MKHQHTVKLKKDQKEDLGLERLDPDFCQEGIQLVGQLPDLRACSLLDRLLERDFQNFRNQGFRVEVLPQVKGNFRCNICQNVLSLRNKQGKGGK